MCLAEDVEEEVVEEMPRLSSLCHKIFIAPLADLSEEPEVIIVALESLYKVPFAALGEEEETYLSENYRIRMVPSLTTFKLIQDGSADYHSEIWRTHDSG